MAHPLDGVVIGLERIVRACSAGTNNQRFNIPRRALNKQAGEVWPKGFFHFSAGDAGIIGRYRVVLANDVRVAGVIHDDGARLALAVFDLDDPNLGVDRPERNAVGVLARVMIVRQPRIPGNARHHE